ncbi:hypothetical protein CJ030_MR3G018235 [Morella rubra]|uniref:Uncharacterized protein n=1 Tax=Morella rubra TaxID=262757 RepID=A0A6A1VJZ5_9ROSI|nr:hypothetical protein CJ030_MR5G018202 [Morella rubra]KAB1218888.1 hypothetical protein CJ030_MR3G018235 [Morella rubra]
MDATIDATRFEPTSVQLGPINSGTCRRSMSHGSSSQCPLVAPWRLGGMTRAQQDTQALLEIEHSILQAVEKVVAPIINSLATMEKRLEKIESMQLELKKTNDEGRKEITQRIAEIHSDVV